MRIVVMRLYFVWEIFMRVMLRVVAFFGLAARRSGHKVEESVLAGGFFGDAGAPGLDLTLGALRVLERIR